CCESFGEPRLGMHRHSWWLRRFARTAENDSARLPKAQRIIAARRNDSWNGEPREIFGESRSRRGARGAEGISWRREGWNGRARFICARLHRRRRLVEHRATTV